MVMGRALFTLLVMPIAALSTAHAEAAGGIQIAPVMVAMSANHHISSLRLRNGRDRAVSFEADIYAWSQRDGEDVLTPTHDVLISPGVFEIPAGHEQVVRLGVVTPDVRQERAYRLVLRELPSPTPRANTLGFTLEMSLPVFVTPVGARPDLVSRIERSQGAARLLISNQGAAHLQILGAEDPRSGALHAPRYLLAGAAASIELGPDVQTIRLDTADLAGARSVRTIDVAPSGSGNPER
jgi:fimbrial chaperone protein